MNIAIISSTKDRASINIKESLINNFNFDTNGVGAENKLFSSKLEEQFDNNNIYQYTINNEKNNQIIIKLYTINSELIFTDDLDKEVDADVFIFISKHRAQEGRASLTCHAIGNFGKADQGGKEKTLCVSNSILLKNIFIELYNNTKEPYEATLEATHHGPFMEKPVLFVELGSNEKYWEDKKGGEIVAKSIIGVIKNFNNKIKINEKDNNLMNGNNVYESIFVIGGSHYNHVANKTMLNTNLAVGHICAKYNLENLNENMIKQAMEKIIPKPKFVLLDWKGLGKEKQRILEILERNNIGYKRSDKVF